MENSHSHPEIEKPAKPAASPCSCTDSPPADACCDLICFERPRYFCGHLLTDADLSQEQRYIIEKHKLYHRSLHGHGVVCGLRLTCDPECSGRIIVGEGYAIDDCGHDLIVCEPRPFDVIEALHLEAPVADPCEPVVEKPRCKVRECYQVTICYDEEEAEFTTPFVGGCRPKLSECEPTRVRETVRFELIDELPKKPALADYFKKPLQCFDLFTKGQFHEILQSQLMSAALRDGPDPVHPASGFRDLFCQLRHWLLRDLAKYSDQYNCAIKDEINAISEPAISGPAVEQRRESFCLLLQIAWRRAVSCALGHLLPACADPGQAGCVVLGTVEIEDGKLLRVCNCPRTFVWSAANFLPVLISSAVNLFGSLRKQDDVCCGDYDVGCNTLAWLFGARMENRDMPTMAEGSAATRTAAAANQPHAVLRRVVNQMQASNVSSNLAQVGIELDEATINGFFGLLHAAGLTDAPGTVARSAPTTQERLDALEKKIDALSASEDQAKTQKPPPKQPESRKKPKG